MKPKETTQTTFENIKIECETCREMLVRGLMQLKTLELNGLNLSSNTKQAAEKKDPKQIHNYNPLDAYRPTGLEKTYSGKPNKHSISK